MFIQSGPAFKFEGVNLFICISGSDKIQSTQITRVVTKESPIKQEMVSVILDEKQIRAIASTQLMNCSLGDVVFSFSDLTKKNLYMLIAANPDDISETVLTNDQKKAIDKSMQDATTATDANHSPPIAPPSTKHTPATPSRNTTSDGSCSCASHDYCVGTRGGVYCYTSGGNKRYVKH